MITFRVKENFHKNEPVMGQREREKESGSRCREEQILQKEGVDERDMMRHKTEMKME